MAPAGDDLRRLAPGRDVWFEKPGTEPRMLRVASNRGTPGRPLVRFEGVESREDAEGLAGGELSVRFDPSDLGEGEYYAHQLRGLVVRTVHETDVGKISGVVFAPGRAYLEIAVAGRSGTLLIPFHGDIVSEVDLTAGRVIIDPPEGLLDL